MLQVIVFEGQDKNPDMCRVLLTHEIMCRCVHVCEVVQSNILFDLNVKILINLTFPNLKHSKPNFI